MKVAVKYQENQETGPNRTEEIEAQRAPQKSSQGEARAYWGKSAKDLIIRRLARSPKARAFASEVCDFYGNCLQYIENSSLDSSHYQIRLQHQPIKLQSVGIELQLGTPRTSEALVHELLHLNTRIQGYPIGHTFSIPCEISRYAGFIADSYPKIVNILEHELIIDDFLNLGFGKKNFLGYLSPAHDYKGLASKGMYSPGRRGDIGFSWWCTEYLRHWVSTRHWVGDEAEIYADSALYWGSKLYPEMRQTARKVRELIRSGGITDTKQHHLHVNQLLALMKIPVFTSWVTIKTSKKGNPVATPMIHGYSWPFLGRYFPLAGAHFLETNVHNH